jgi:hypothetical protein
MALSTHARVGSRGADPETSPSYAELRGISSIPQKDLSSFDCVKANSNK